MAIKHVKVATVPDDGISEVGTDEWNDDHTIEDNTITDDMVSSHTTTKITVPTTQLSGTVTNTQLAGSIDNTKLATDPLARANHTGTQAQSTVTDLVSDLTSKAPIASPTFTGTVTIPNVADLETAVVANTAKVGLSNTAVTDAHLAGNISLSKLANGTAGKIVGFNASTGVVEEQDKPSASAGILIPHSTTGGDYTSATATSLVYQGSYATETVSAPSSLSAYSNVTNAYDGNLSTYAETTSSPWLGTGADAFTIDYGKVLYGVGIQSLVHNYHNGFGTGISIGYSIDGSTWTNFYSQTDNNINTWINTGTFNLTNVNVRYLRVNRAGGNGYNKVRIYELKVTNMSAPDVESITSDFGADKLVCGINVNVGEIDDSTITISTSDDNSTYTLNRTVLTSKMSENGNNFIRMNPTSCRYVKIIGVTPDNISRATASFAQLPDADGYIKPDSYVLANHEHATISTTDTSLGLDGS